MNKQSGNKTSTGTDIEEVKKLNKQPGSANGMGKQYGAEFGSETDVEQVKKQNQQSEQSKSKNAYKPGQSGNM